MKICIAIITAFVLITCTPRQEKKPITILATNIRVATAKVHGQLFSDKIPIADFIIENKEAVDFYWLRFPHTGLNREVFDLIKFYNLGKEDSCTKVPMNDFQRSFYINHETYKDELEHYVLVLNKKDADGIYRDFKFRKAPFIYRNRRAAQIPHISYDISEEEWKGGGMEPLKGVEDRWLNIKRIKIRNPWPRGYRPNVIKLHIADTIYTVFRFSGDTMFYYEKKPAPTWQDALYRDN